MESKASIITSFGGQAGDVAGPDCRTAPVSTFSARPMMNVHFVSSGSLISQLADDNATIRSPCRPDDACNCESVGFVARSTVGATRVRQNRSELEKLDGGKNGLSVLSKSAAANGRRTSLHGKPLSTRMNRNDARYRRMQGRIYNFLERPKTWRAITYQVLV
ncbi:unnamed protein product [Protopolystoma xenopodis]|uniref:Uncharacterized protein n=1 Tax=Protopolystoma xenopodis TaxID=117903 RepID=A0A448X7Y5_9PLAT|nr:unnamed protein product [Protopolystoma xenopodis]